jgi:hypothetical protein
LAAAIQDEIVGWLRRDGENGAAAWFERYWTGDRGNYTNASAGYAGNNNAQGIESRWRYMKREVCGTAGQNLRMSLRNFVPALLAYLKSASARHMGKLFKANAELNTNFVGRPSFEPEMWRLAQRLDTRTLSLSHIECNYDFQRAWKKITDEIAAIGEALPACLEEDPYREDSAVVRHGRQHAFNWENERECHHRAHYSAHQVNGKAELYPSQGHRGSDKASTSPVSAAHAQGLG